MPTDPPSSTTPPLGASEQQACDHLADVFQAQGLSEGGAETLATMMVSASGPSNPFLNNNPMVALFETFSQIAHSAQQIQDLEHRQHAMSMRFIMATANDQADLIRTKAELDAKS